MHDAIANDNTLQRRLLPPLLALLLLLLVVFWFALQSLNRQQVTLQAQQQSQRITAKFNLLQAERTGAMDLAMKAFIRMDPELVPMIAARDREGLREAYALTFGLFGQRLAVSHFYFHGPDRRTVLRMHDPQAFGDEITRQTLIDAELNWAVSSGLEFGRNGVLSLRAVHPIGLPDKPMGFLELGIEIDDLLTDLRANLSEDLDFEYAVAITKDSEFGKNWYDSAVARGDGARWNDHEGLVVADYSMDFPQNVTTPLVTRLSTMDPNQRNALELELNGRHWIATPIALDSMAGDIQLVALTDATELYNTFDRIMQTAFAIAAALCALLLAGFYQALRRVNGTLENQQQALKQTGERLELALAVANDGIWDWDLPSNSVVFDDRYYTVAGYAPGAFPSTFDEFAKRIHDDDRAQVDAAIQDHLNGGQERFIVEFRFLNADNRYMWIRGRGKIVKRDADGNPVRFIGTHSDISALKNAEQTSVLAAEMLDKRNRILSSINRMGRDLAAAGSIEEVGRMAVELLREQDGAPLVGIYLYDETAEPPCLRLSYYDAKRVENSLFETAATMPVENSFNGLALTQGEIVHCNNFAEDDRINPAVREIFARHGAMSEVVLPLIHRDQWIGTIAIVYLESINYSEEDRWAHNAIAQSVSIAIDNLRNLQALRLGQQTAEGVNELSYELNRSQDVGALAQRALSTLVRREQDSTKAVFYLINNAGDLATVVAFEGISDEEQLFIRRLPIDGTWTGASLSAERVVSSDDASWEKTISPDIARTLRDGGVRSLVAIPLIYQSKVLGSINLLFETEETFDQTRLLAYDSMGRAISLALHNAQNTALLAYQASHDSLTDLPNRKALHEQVAAMLDGGSPPEELSMLLLDLDRFKEVNDTLGHHLGDNLLRALAKRVAPLATVYGSTLYRLGGDEFAILAETGDAERIAEHISSALKHPFSLNDMNLELDCSIGGAVYPEHGANSHELLRCADIAMYAAKKKAESFVLYDLSLDDKNPQRLEMLGALRNAIAQNQLHLVYQPRVEVASQQVVSCEALLRWNHETLGHVSPDDFIPLAEMTDVIHSLTPWVIRTALQQIRRWRDEGFDTRVSINISGRNLIDVNFPKRVEALLQEYGIEASTLEFEITETALVSDPDRALMVLRTLAGLGISIAIDDFGTGYSSLDYLKRLPLNALKVDRSFIKDMLEQEKDAAIVQSTIGLAHSLGLRVVAEGAEDVQTKDRLLELGCEEVQGYFYSRPLPPEDFVRWTSTHGGGDPDDGDRTDHLVGLP